MIARRLFLAALAFVGGALIVLFWMKRAPRDTPTGRDARNEATQLPASTRTELPAPMREETSDGLVDLAVLDDTGSPVADAEVDIISVDALTRIQRRTDKAGHTTLPAGNYIAWVHADGHVDSFGACALAQPTQLRIERCATVALAFQGDSTGLRVKLLPEPDPEDANGIGFALLERERLRTICFSGDGSLAQLDGFLSRVGGLPFGPTLSDSILAEQKCDAQGRAQWRNLPSATYRWQLLSRTRVSFDPPYEVPRFTEDDLGRLEIHASPVNLSGPFSVAPGSIREFTPRVEIGARVTGTVASESGPVEGARVTLRAVARSTRTRDVAVAPEAYARTDANGAFLFEEVPPGEKEVFAILDEATERRFRITQRLVAFELAEGEERDLGLISMAGATVHLSARLIDDNGQTLPLKDVIVEPEPWALLTLTNNMRQAESPSFSTTLWVRLGEDFDTTISGLTPVVSATVSSFRAKPDGPQWTLRPGYREDLETAARVRFDPYTQSRVVINIPIQAVHSCELSIRTSHTDLPPGTPLQGTAIRISDGRRMSFQPTQEDAGVHSHLELAEGEHYLFVWSAMPGGRPFFARGRVDVPLESRVELHSEAARALSGVFLHSNGTPASSTLSRVAFTDMPEGRWWTTARANEHGRFELPAVPVGARLAFEGATGLVSGDAQDGVSVTVAQPSDQR